MNFSRQQFSARNQQNNLAPKTFHLSLKKKRNLKQEQEFAKENNPSAANTNVGMCNYRNAEICRSESSSSPDSQNYNLRLSDSFTDTIGKKEPSYPKSNDLRHATCENRSIVLVSNSSASSTNSNESSPCADKSKKSTVYTPLYRSKERSRDNPTDTIVLDSSDSEENCGTNKDCKGVITLDSDDDSVLNTLRIEKDVFKKSKKSNSRYLETDNLSLGSTESVSKILTGSDERGDKNSGKIGRAEFAQFLNRRNNSHNCTSGSSSTNFTPDSNIAQNNGLLVEYKVISESSSSNDESSRGLSADLKHNDNFRTGKRRSKLNKLTSSENQKGNKSLANISSKSNAKSLLVTKPYDSVKLTKKDAQRIFKGGNNSTNSHWTPNIDSPYFKETRKSLSCSSLDGPDEVKRGNVINETESDLLMTESSSDKEIIDKSPQNLRLSKTHISRFVDPPNQEQQYAGLSDRKKNEISEWLSNNSPGSTNSSSIISESNRNSSFGNSSLERFELKHETPNNRGKLLKPDTSEQVMSIPGPLDRFIYKGKTSVLKNQTPLGVGSTEKTNTSPDQLKMPTPRPKPAVDEKKKNQPIVTATQGLHIDDCANILDKLYGDLWRKKADAVLTPQTNLRTQKKVINRKVSQTERKQTSKAAIENGILSSSEDDEFEIFTKDIRPNFNSTKKKLSRDSFINDKSPSENSSESFYYTALTNPRVSKENFPPKPQPTLISASTKKAIAICDSDSDDDNCHLRSDKDLNRRRLSFSEDASNSSTSEFDPGEIVLPKPNAKKVPAKKMPLASKFNDIISTQQQMTKSFLASLSATIPIQYCHPEARAFRENYKNKKEELCKYLFKLYNKEIFDGKLPDDMALEWNVRMRGTAGFCYNKKSIKSIGGIVRSSRIVLATKILDTPDRLRDTLVHEMCHAAAWLINQVSDGHGPYWKGWASKAVKKFPELPPIKRCHDYKIKTKYTYRCTKCGYSIGRHSKSLNVENKRCGHCYGKFELLINRTTRSGTMQTATPAQTRTPSSFALYVKENYHSVKKDRRSIKHADVMKILGQQFSAVKIGRKQGEDNKTCR
ncbi:serine-rich adhesin for platelets [Neodiprion pinetum]|uniref:serine-rich adhesin for platelets n=1 Tax=Neodiprion pinetum TaxID=441929 RepID=UPI001EDE9FEE|nr:uncharacterized protein LOC124216542 [Neodiprion pinetum]